MKFGFAMHGSRGDVQPGVAVAVALAGRGHEVTVAAPENLAPDVARTGLPTKVLGPDTTELLKSPLVKERLKSRNPRTRMRALKEMGAHGAERSETVMAELAEDADVLVTGMLAQERAATIAESRGIAFAPLHYCPVRPNQTVAPLNDAVPRWGRRAFWTLGDRMNWWTVRGGDTNLRRRLGMKPAAEPLSARMRDAGAPEIQAYDPALFPGLAEEWGGQRPFTGFLLPEAETRIALNGDAGEATARTIEWAQADEPPVYVGFGSMQVEPERVRDIVGWLSARGSRVIAHTPHELPAGDGVLRVTAALDHEQLFPHCRGAVHHGGAGTTAAAARAGIPAVIGWLSADQPLWASVLRGAGSGGGRRLTKLTDDDLAPLVDPSAARAAADLADQLTSPVDAVAATCDILVARAR